MEREGTQGTNGVAGLAWGAVDRLERDEKNEGLVAVAGGHRGTLGRGCESSFVCVLAPRV